MLRLVFVEIATMLDGTRFIELTRLYMRKHWMMQQVRDLHESAALKSEQSIVGHSVQLCRSACVQSSKSISMPSKFLGE